jgi:NtrC-family two-component system response regulator AlgB
VALDLARDSPIRSLAQPVLIQRSMVQLAEQTGANFPGYRPRVLVVEREARVRAAFSRCLEALNCAVVTTSTIGDALDAVEHRSFDLAFVDPAIEIELGRDLGSRLLDEMPGLTLVLITSCTSFGTSLSERLRSSCEHIPAAFTPGQIKHIVERFCEQRLLRLRLAEAERRVHRLQNDVLIAESAAMRAALENARSAARSDALVVLCGERGTGRATLARFIHRNSPQAAGPFVVANLLGVSEESATSELFGSGRNVLSGSHHGRAGLVEAAEDGTLFLEELGDISASLESPLLRLLQHRDFERVGELRVRHSNARIVGTSGSDFGFLRQRSGDATEKSIAVVRIHVPPLRDRHTDVVPLARMFLEGFARSMRRGELSFTAAAEAALATYPWPGNIPELRNVVERAVLLHRASTVDTCDLPECIAWSAERIPQIGGDFSVDQIEQEHIRRVVSRAESEVAATKILGISRSTLWRKRNARLS